MKKAHKPLRGHEMKIHEQTTDCHDIMRTVNVSVHTWKHLKYIKHTTHDCKTMDDAIDILLHRAKRNWDCMDKDDFADVVGD